MVRGNTEIVRKISTQGYPENDRTFYNRNLLKCIKPVIFDLVPHHLKMSGTVGSLCLTLYERQAGYRRKKVDGYIKRFLRDRIAFRNGHWRPLMAGISGSGAREKAAPAHRQQVRGGRNIHQRSLPQGIVPRFERGIQFNRKDCDFRHITPQRNIERRHTGGDPRIRDTAHNPQCAPDEVIRCIRISIPIQRIGGLICFIRKIMQAQQIVIGRHVHCQVHPYR